jgi:hypothetical protein
MVSNIQTQFKMVNQNVQEVFQMQEYVPLSANRYSPTFVLICGTYRNSKEMSMDLKNPFFRDFRKEGLAFKTD